jgi:hypothetical protein
VTAYASLLKGVRRCGFRGHVEALTREPAPLHRQQGQSRAPPELRVRGLRRRARNEETGTGRAAGLSRLDRRSQVPRLIGCIADRATAHPHKDGVLEGRMHVWINLLIAKPDARGIAELDGLVIYPKEGDGWLCFASSACSAMGFRSRRRRRLRSARNSCTGR